MNKFFAITPALAALAALAAIFNAASAQVAPVFDPPGSQPFISDTNNTIYVTGTATANVQPDRVMVTLAVETVNETAGDALRANSEALTRVLAALAQAGVQENETGTAYFSITPNYNVSEFGGRQELTGYTVTNSIVVESLNLQDVSRWVDVAVAAGANRVDGIMFTVSPGRIDDIRADLARQAVDNARTKADALASALDVGITGVKSASQVDFEAPISPLLTSFAEATSAEARVPIIPGEQTVTTTVTVIYEIG